MAKTITIEGLGDVSFVPVSISEVTGKAVSKDGTELKFETGRAEGSYMGYVNPATGEKVSRTELQRQFTVDGETFICPPFEATKSVASADIKIVPAQEAVKSQPQDAIDKKIYKVTKLSDKLKKILDEGNVVTFPFVISKSYQMYNGFIKKKHLKDGSDAYAIYATYGDEDEALGTISDDAIEIPAQTMSPEAMKLAARLRR